MAKKILVVDDDHDTREMLCLSFRAAGYQTDSAGNGAEGMKKARSFSPDLIILDLMLPEMDGFIICEELRREPATSTVPIIMLTAMPGELARVVGLAAGATEYINKPFETQQLLRRVHRHLSVPPASQEEREAA
jgi:DNA-binding response OmpR family regulator